METNDPLIVINNKLNLKANMRLTGDEIKCWVPDNYGSGILIAVFSAEDCKELGKAFNDLAKNLKKPKKKPAATSSSKLESAIEAAKKTLKEVSAKKKTSKPKKANN